MRKISAFARFLLVAFFLFAGFDECFRSPSHVAMEKEKTLAIIKPDGLSGNVTLFYAEHSKKSFFPSLVEYMTSGPVLIMVLEKPNAISDWRALIGPTDSRKAKVSHPNSIRAMCGLDTARNCVHGSDSLPSAAREISFFFGDILPGFVKHDEL